MNKKNRSIFAVMPFTLSLLFSCQSSAPLVPNYGVQANLKYDPTQAPETQPCPLYGLPPWMTSQSTSDTAIYFAGESEIASEMQTSIKSAMSNAKKQITTFMESDTKTVSFTQELSSKLVENSLDSLLYIPEVKDKTANTVLSNSRVVKTCYGPISSKNENGILTPMYTTYALLKINSKDYYEIYVNSIKEAIINNSKQNLEKNPTDKDKILEDQGKALKIVNDTYAKF